MDKAKKTAEHVLSLLGGAFASGMIYLGDRLGLYQALYGAESLTSEDLAAQDGAAPSAGFREWLQGQAAAGLIDLQRRRFALSPEAAMVLGTRQALVPWLWVAAQCRKPMAVHGAAARPPRPSALQAIAQAGLLCSRSARQPPAPAATREPALVQPRLAREILTG